MFKALGHWFKQIFGSSQPDQPGMASLPQAESNSQMAEQFDSIDMTSHLVPYDENLLERTRTQWQFGDWHSLANLDSDNLQHHPDRAKLILLAAAGRLQIGQDSEARQYLRIAKDWGCSKKQIIQILISSAHNTIGTAAAIGAQQQRAVLHFEKAIGIGRPTGDLKLLTQARIDYQYSNISKLLTNDSPLATNFTIDQVEDRNYFKIRGRLNEVRSENNKIRRENKFLEDLLFQNDLESIHHKITESKNRLLANLEKFNGKLIHRLAIKWVKKDPDSWLTRHIKHNNFEIHEQPFDALIEYVANVTNRNGALPLWVGYNYSCIDNQQQSRLPNQVRIGNSIGSFFTWLTRTRQPNQITEIGSAFGVSGMYWAAGIELNGHGNLTTFEANEVWQLIAKKNISLITSKFSSICGPVEDHFKVLMFENTKIDILFIDAIHTSDVVISQLNFFETHLSAGALVIIDDINFSSDMKSCWSELSTRNCVASSLEIKDRIGIIEYK